MKIIDNIRLTPDAGRAEIEAEIIKRFGGQAKLLQSVAEPLDWVILKRSIDARRHSPVVCWRIGVLEKGETDMRPEGIASLAQALRQDSALKGSAKSALSAAGSKNSDLRPVVVGTGPAGIFAALLLAEAGLRPLVVEQGEAVPDRVKSVAAYWREGAGRLNPHSNVQFGEGGAGTFSDGKLNTGTKSRYHRLILESFVLAGAPSRILYETKPHLGTDVLQNIVPALRRRIIALGGEVRFNTELVDLTIDRGRLSALSLRSVLTGDRVEMPARHLLLAPGHSARPLLVKLYEIGISLEQKDFAVGVRVEHSQALVNQSLYGAGNCRLYPQLPPASYKLVCHIAETGRSAYSFCMCPGGQVVASASGPRQVVTNGMSFSDRGGDRANSALLVNVKSEDLSAYARFSGDPLAGFFFQADLEERAFLAAGGHGFAPAQSAVDFLRGHISAQLPATTYAPGSCSLDLNDLLPPFVTHTLKLALPRFAGRFADMKSGRALLIGPESRSSSPVRMLRDPETRQSNIGGLFPAGEGAGYAGGIMSAAADGIKSAIALYQALSDGG